MKRGQFVAPPADPGNNRNYRDYRPVEEIPKLLPRASYSLGDGKYEQDADPIAFRKKPLRTSSISPNEALMRDDGCPQAGPELRFPSAGQGIQTRRNARGQNRSSLQKKFSIR
jgi:hypothetical protein